jgi:hypothetical protein
MSVRAVFAPRRRIVHEEDFTHAILHAGIPKGFGLKIPVKDTFSTGVAFGITAKISTAHDSVRFHH